MIHQILADALAREVQDPRIGFATVTGVHVTNDLSYATVWVSIMGDPTEQSAGLEGLQSARGFLRSVVARAMRLRLVPELRFELDRGLDHAKRISELLDNLKHEDSA
jgi:ribosome-binding factor A